MGLKTFAYNAVDLKTAVSYQLDVPLPEFCSFDEVFGHFVCKTKLLEPFHKGKLFIWPHFSLPILGARQALQNFIRIETQNHYDQIAEDAVIGLLDANEDLDTARIYTLLKMVRFIRILILHSIFRINRQPAA
jgi:hypothetical protein